MSILKLFAGLLALPFVLGQNDTCTARFPEVKVVNGTYQGRHIPGWDQDVFLGMRYAQPPNGTLRFRRPQYINESWSDVRSVFNYSHACAQFSPPNVFANDVSEDCLSINVVRPARTAADAKLPILVWIYGGGFDGGGSSDPRYNMSGLVSLSQKMGKPIIGVSFNYRLNKLGFMHNAQILSEGSANAGMHDQRLALMWIQANLGAFGGDTSRVTIWGESAGAQAIGLHLHAYDGKDEGLYQAAIMESGGPVGAAISKLEFYGGWIESLSQQMGCYGASDVIACFRSVPFEKWQNTSTTILLWNPLIDGELWTDYPSMLAAQQKFLKVPVIIGTNSDEGCTFAPTGINNETALWQKLLSHRNYLLRPPTAKKLLELYPDDPASSPPYYLNPNPVIFPEKGLAWRRAAAIVGDMVMIAGRRRVSEQWTAAGQAVYSYRFDQLGYGENPNYGVGHFQNVAFSFQNITGALGPLPAYESNKVLSENIGRAYISFVNDFDPNTSRGGGSTLPYWPKYDLAAPKNIVLNATKSFVEDDTYRKAGIDFLNRVDVDLEVLA